MKAKSKSSEDARRFIHAVATHQGWGVNPDPAFVERLAEGLAINFNRYGFFQCPCRDSWGDKRKDADIACPCTYCAEDQQEYGHCYCGLFLTQEFLRNSGGRVSSIPERRPEGRFP